MTVPTEFSNVLASKNCSSGRSPACKRVLPGWLAAGWLALAALAYPLAYPLAASAQQAPAGKPLAAASTAKAPAVAVKTESSPKWADITPSQQKALAPLADSWSGISEPQKRKWLEISTNYPALSASDQATMHSRMVEWVALSPQQRAQARLNFAKTRELSKELSPAEKKAKWETYQALSPEEKKELADKGPAKSAGAATAVKPVAPQKLAVTSSKPGATTTAVTGTAAGAAASALKN